MRPALRDWSLPVEHTATFSETTRNDIQRKQVRNPLRQALLRIALNVVRAASRIVGYLRR